jgi:RNA polymerase subunit RPABC4/transcription elongation factor Spt4
MPYKPDSVKISTKHCPICGNENLLLFRTLNLKACTDCFRDINWYLEEDQQPLI